MADSLFVTMEMGGWQKKVKIYFYSLRPIVQFGQKTCTKKIKKSYRPGVFHISKDELDVDHRFMFNHTISDLGVSSVP